MRKRGNNVFQTLKAATLAIVGKNPVGKSVLARIARNSIYDTMSRDNGHTSTKTGDNARGLIRRYRPGMKKRGLY